MGIGDFGGALHAGQEWRTARARGAIDSQMPRSDGQSQQTGRTAQQQPEDATPGRPSYAEVSFGQSYPKMANFNLGNFETTKLMGQAH
jgi:hypothetical protein